MKTFERVCTRDFQMKDKIGNILKLEKGKKYLTSAKKDGIVMVFTKYWINVPSNLFGKRIIFTKD